MAALADAVKNTEAYVGIGACTTQSRCSSGSWYDITALETAISAMDGQWWCVMFDVLPLGVAMLVLGSVHL